MNVIWIVLDALRADHLSAYGYERDTAPNLAAIAQDGVVFDAAFTSTTWTRPAAATLLTSTYPRVHGVHRLSDRLGLGVPTVAELLGEAGVQTAAFSAAGNVSTSVGLGRGFDHFVDLYQGSDRDLQADPRRASNQVHLPTAEEVFDSYSQWRKGASRTQPSLAMLWFLDIHAPYDPPSEYRIFGRSRSEAPPSHKLDVSFRSASAASRLQDWYDSEIRYVDAVLGRIVDQLQTSGLYDETAIMIFSDHGEAFFEHGAFGHGLLPHEELIKIPLIMKLPGSAHAGRRVSELAWIGDLGPTSAGLLGAPAAREALSGNGAADLSDLLADEKRPWRSAIYSDSAIAGLLRNYYSVRTADAKLIATGKNVAIDDDAGPPVANRLALAKVIRLLSRPVSTVRRLRGQRAGLYDLGADPREREDLSKARPDELMHLQSQLSCWLEACDAGTLTSATDAAPLSESEEAELRSHLRALGYLE
jgi:arylsulfatase